MKRFTRLVVICGAASCIAINVATSPTNSTIAGAAAPSSKHASPAKPTASDLAKSAAAKEASHRARLLLLAPADEYFGPLKLSIIGMRNSIRDIGLRYDTNHDLSKQSFASTQLVERSVRDWAKKYHGDDQLPRTIFILQRLYTKVLLQESRDRAVVIGRWLNSEFSRTPQAKQLAKTLALEHLAPLPPPTPTPTALPTGYQSIFGPNYPSEFNSSPTSSAEPGPTKVPAAGPTAVPTSVSTTAPTPTASAHP